jgi:hypothetical protein
VVVLLGRGRRTLAVGRVAAGAEASRVGGRLCGENPELAGVGKLKSFVGRREI